LVREGTPLFASYRDCSLRDVDRSLFFAASMYRRSLGLMMASASPWAHVTLYYAAFYASKAILGMFGVSIFYDTVIDVQSGAIGAQILRVRLTRPKGGQWLTTYKGSHKAYWDLFYQAVASLQPLLDPRKATALTPIGNDRTWLINSRNRVNYDSYNGLRVVEAFQRAFDPNSFPQCLAGDLGTLYTVSERLLEVAFEFAGNLALATDALQPISNSPSREQAIAELVFHNKPPGLVRKSIKSLLT
jgi:hypothetical protein